MRVFPQPSRHRRRCLSLGLAAGAIFFGGVIDGHALQISEYFNDYGTGNVSLVGLNGGIGWGAAWAGNANTYVAGVQAAYSATGYSGTGNQSDANDGAGGGTGTGTISYRIFATPLTGTVWISFTLQQTTLGQDVLFWLDRNDSNGTSTGVRNFVALRGSTLTDTTNNPTKIPEPVISYNGDDGTNNQTFGINSPHLVLLKIDMNYSSALDRLSFWIDPDLSGGEAGLGTALYVKSGTDVYGTTFEGVGLSTTSSNNVVDSIRASNDADGFAFVTTAIPEPAGIGLTILGAGMLGLNRRCGIRTVGSRKV